MTTRNPHLFRKRVQTLLLAGGVAGMAMTLSAEPAQSGTKDAIKGEAVVKRDPFWPVGYVPANAQVDVGESPPASPVRGSNSWNEAMKRVVINGVSSRADNEYFAVINGEVKSVGDTISIVLDSTVYTWAVDGIEPPGSVKLRRVSAR